MKKCHRDKIEKYRCFLIEHTNFQALWEQLKDDTELFQAYMTQDILSTANNSERNERFYNQIQDCGPSAFKRLTDGLSLSGQNELSLLLLEDKLLTNEEDPSRSLYYPPLPPVIPYVNVLKSPRPSQWTKVLQKDARYSYFVDSRPRGYLLLINMNFHNNPMGKERKGSEVDVRLLKELFTQLNYEIICECDLTFEEMVRCVYNFSHMKELEKVDSVVVFIMSHGRNPSERRPYEDHLKSPGRESVDIELEDHKFINSNDIVDEINGSSTIRNGVPKLFFFNVCRGGRADMGPNSYLSSPYESHEDTSIAPQNTSTQIDAHPYNIATGVELDIPPDFHNHSNSENNGTVSNSNPSSGTNNQITELVEVSTITNEQLMNNNSEVVQRSNGVDASPPRPPFNMLRYKRMSGVVHENVTVCCCFSVRNDKFKRKTFCVRLAIWLSKKFKCSMPSQVEENDIYTRRPYEEDIKEKPPCTNGSMSSHPSGPTNRSENDSPDSGHSGRTVECYWPDEPENPQLPATEVQASVPRSNSKASRSGSPPILDRIKNMVQIIIHPKRHTADIFMAFSTVDGYQSMRHPQRGSWFVTLVCQVFAESAKDTDLISMMEEVDRRLRGMLDHQYGRQICVQKKEGFNKKFFFNVDIESESPNSSEPVTPE